MTDLSKPLQGFIDTFASGQCDETCAETFAQLLEYAEGLEKVRGELHQALRKVAVQTFVATRDDGTRIEEHNICALCRRVVLEDVEGMVHASDCLAGPRGAS